MTENGGLILVFSPIGNMGDLTPRAAEALREADLWVVEDTRVSAKLASVLEVKKPMRVLNDHTRPDAVDRLADEIAAGARAALLTDGGAPAVSDPGAMLTDRLLDRGIPVTAAPGPSAPVTALALSGFFAQRFAFLGFLGRKAGDIRKELAPFADSPYTLVLFESPHRFRQTLETGHSVLGERRYAICREMTKAYEQIWRGRLPALPTEAEVPGRGEFTLVIEGVRRRETSAGEG